MHSFPEWLERLLSTGESVQDGPPSLVLSERRSVEGRLRAAFDQHALDVAGPPIAFDPDAALRAAEVLARACWLLVSGDEGTRPALALDPARAPGANLSADVTLRFLPVVHRRARARGPDGTLVIALDRILRAWPLSGVLADLDGEPVTAPDFGHPGLQLLYAERLAATGRAGWVPATGPVREWVERVFAERGVPVPVPLPQEDARA
ncbi:hypothetical protein [Frigoriglobus tundricola]|uniref:MoxR-vWA-beta-propeller ternary system domain-containing protein n=1 Tax=Frigoriglobus tundricola TaxID=2774151 RepID=A0A6M5YXZ0_9BACT|nr:hypothetical protein [Frigoriglobus tundricola]QJW98879.1 hypothetical protein FTUN_6474 [Frigoriglobus tundricola]